MTDPHRAWRIGGRDQERQDGVCQRSSSGWPALPETNHENHDRDDEQEMDIAPKV